MATIKKIDVTTSTYQGKEKKSYLFTLDDGTQGYPAKDPWDFKEGELVTYTKEVRKSKQNKEYNLLTLTRVASSAPPTPQQSAPQEKLPERQDEILLPRTRGISSAKTIGEMKFEARVYCLKLAVKCLLAKAIDYPQVKQYYTEWVELIDASIDEIKG